jgi:hypothetical protein
LTINYCDWPTGDDTTGDGSAGNPYKTITKASQGLAGGDEVRCAKSPDPTDLDGTEVLDVSQANRNYLVGQTATFRYMGFVFTAGISGKLSKIKLWIGRTSSQPTHDLTVELRNVVSDEPGMTIYASKSKLCTVPTGGQEEEFVFDTPVPITEGIKYSIVFHHLYGGTAQYRIYGLNSMDYLYYDTTSYPTWSLYGADVCPYFKTYVIEGVFEWVDDSNIVRATEDFTASLFTKDFIGKGTSGETWWEIASIQATQVLFTKDYIDTNLNYPLNVFVSGDYAYVTSNGNDRLCIYDISNPSNIVAKDYISTNLDNPHSVFVVGNYAYVTSNTNDRLCIFDISDPDNIVAKDYISTNLDAPHGIFVVGNYAYVASYANHRLCIFDISDPNSIVAKDYISTNLSRPEGIYVSGNYAYIASFLNNRLCIFDISDPNSIVAKDYISTNLNQPYNVSVSGNYAYVTSGNNDRLCIFDISDPNSIVAKDYTSTNLDSPKGITVSGNYAYVSSEENSRLCIFDVSDPNSIVAGDYISTNIYKQVGLYLLGNYIYMASYNNSRLCIFNTVSGSKITLVVDYYGTTETVPSQKLGVTDTGTPGSQYAIVQQINSSGSSGAGRITISGGWNLSTETQDGETWFWQSGTNRWGMGLYMNGKAYLDIEDVNFLRYAYNVNLSGTDTKLSSMTSIASERCIYISGSNNRRWELDGVNVYDGTSSGAIYIIDVVDLIIQNVISRQHSADYGLQIIEGVFVNLKSILSNRKFNFTKVSNAIGVDVENEEQIHSSYSEVAFINSSFTTVTFPGDDYYSRISSHNHNDTAGNHIKFTPLGTISRNTTESVSGSCMDFDPSNATRYLQDEFFAPVDSGDDVTFNISLKKDSSFNGNCTLEIEFEGVTIQGPTDVTPTVADTYQTKSISVSSHPSIGVLKLVLKVRGTVGHLYADDLNVERT